MQENYEEGEFDTLVNSRFFFPSLEKNTFLPGQMDSLVANADDLFIEGDRGRFKKGPFQGRLVIARHPVYDEWTGKITDEGRSQYETLGANLAERNLGSVRILASTATRAQEGAEVLEDKLGLDSSKRINSKFLETPAKPGDEKNSFYNQRDPNRIYSDNPGLLRLIDQAGEEVDTVIVVAHYEVCDFFPEFYLLGMHSDRHQRKKGRSRCPERLVS